VAKIMDASMTEHTTRGRDRLKRADVTAIFLAGAQRNRGGRNPKLLAMVMTQYGAKDKQVRDIWNLKTWADTTHHLWTDADKAQWRANTGQKPKPKPSRKSGQAASDTPITPSVGTKIEVPVVSLRTLCREEATAMVIEEV
jgi:hypothetical protein